MGTSSSYGGSQRRDWRRVREILQEETPGELGSNDDSDDDDIEASEADDDDLADALAAAAASALISEEPLLGVPNAPVNPFLLSDLLPRRPLTGGSGGGRGGFGSGNSSSGVGRTGAGSSRSLGKGAARGGAAIAGAFALRNRDAAALADLGLDLAELENLGPRMQCARILDAVLGDGGHPDEQALRQASAEVLKSIILADNPPSPLEAIQSFIGSYVYRIVLVEVRKGINDGSIPLTEAHQKESRLKRWINRSVRVLTFDSNVQLNPSGLMAAATTFLNRALRILRAGGTA